jgi:hypothetical protein
LLRHPDAAAFAARRFRHQAVLVLAGDRRGVHLHELGVGVDGAVHVAAAVGAAGVDGRVGAAAVDDAGAAGRHADGVRGKGLDLHGAQIDGDDAAATALLVLDEAQILPVLVLADQALRLVAAHLLVEGVEELLPGRGAGESGAVVERAAEAAEVEEPFAGAVEGHAHAVEQVDDVRRRVAHALDRRLLGEKVASLERVLDVDVGIVALAFGIDGAVDSALRADRVASLHRHDGEDVHLLPRLGELDHRHQPGEPAPHHDVPLRHVAASLWRARHSA